MLLFLKILILLLFAIVTYEDISSRMVHAIIFPILAIALGYHYLQYTTPFLFFINVIMNLILVSGILLILFVYCKLCIKKTFLNNSFGLGDLFFFYTVSLAFPTMTFVVLFVFSLIFSLALHLIIKQNKIQNTIPLAGYMALFFVIILSVNTLSSHLELYQL